MFNPHDSQLLTSLKIISRIREQNKIRTQHQSISIEGGGLIPVWLKRFVLGERRSSNIDRLNTIFTQAFEVIEKKINAHDKHGYQHFMDEVKRALVGVKNLRVTYEKDTATTSRIDVIIRNIEIALEKYNTDFSSWPMY